MKDEYKRFTVVVIITSVILFALFLLCTEAMKTKLEEDNVIPYDYNPVTSGHHEKVPVALELNKATFEELMQVKGIGRERAYDIISLREKLGKFTSVSQLMLIEDMDKETFSYIEEKLYVEEEWNRFNEEQNAVVEDKVNINTASLKDLMSLDGLTESIAYKIIEHREQNGNFVSINEIMDVKGIGDAIFNSICDYITV